MTDAVLKALIAAAMANLPNAAAAGDTASRTEARMAAAIIAAFLRALPDVNHLPHPAIPGRRIGIRWERSHALAAAVEQAGKEARA